MPTTVTTKKAVLGTPAASIVVSLVLMFVTCLFMCFGSPTSDKTFCNLLIVAYSVVVYLVLLTQAFLRTCSISCYFLLLGTSYPFFFGRQIVDAFHFDLSRTFVSNDWMTVDVLWYASMFVLISIQLLHTGYCFFAEKRECTSNLKCENFKKSTNAYEALRRASLLLLLLLAVPTLIYLVQNIQMTSMVGYGARITDVQYQRSGFSNAFGILASFMPPVLLANFITRRQGEKWQIVVTLIYFALYMTSGSRSSVFSLMVVFLYVWYLCFSKKSAAESMLQIICILIVTAIVFSLGSFARATTSDGVADKAAAFTEKNVLVETLAEAGQTFSVTAKVIDSVPRKVSQANGVTYWSGVVYMLPNGLTGNYYAQVPSVDDVFASELTSYGGVGSSFIAEGYYNFGPYSLILFFFYGILIAKLQNNAERYYRSGSYLGFFVCCATFQFLAFYIRSDTRTFFRNFVWNIVPIAIVQQVAESRLGRRFNLNTVRERHRET